MKGKNIGKLYSAFLLTLGVASVLMIRTCAENSAHDESRENAARMAREKEALESKSFVDCVAGDNNACREFEFLYPDIAAMLRR